MELSTLFIQCRTFRKFTQKEIPETAVNSILEDLRYTHSGNNKQVIQYYVVTSKEKRDALIQQIHFAAILPREIADPKPEEQPTLYFVLVGPADHSRVIDIDTGIAAEILMESAYEKGIGSCMMLNYNVTKVNEILSLPEGLTSLMVVAMGYPCHTSEAVTIGEDGNTAYTVDADYHFKVPKKTVQQISKKL